MNTKIVNRLIIIIAVILTVSGGCFAFLHFSGITSDKKAQKTENSAEGSNLMITNLDVGKADSAVIEYNGTVGIIDVGTEDAFDKIDAFLKEQDIDSIDYVILTHFDRDHIGSAVEIITNYDIGSLYIPDYVSEKKYYEDLMDVAAGLEDVNVVKELTVFYLDDIKVEVVPADDPEAIIEEGDDVDNNMSLLTKFIYGSKIFLFTGDVEKNRISQMLEDDYELNADWIKLPHHNDFGKKVEKLLSEVSPEFAVSSTGEERPIEDDMIAYMEGNNIKHFITYNGDVVTICDCDVITCENVAE